MPPTRTTFPNICLISQNHAKRPIEKPKSSVIHSSTAAVNGKRSEKTIWPSSDDDDDEVSIVAQIQKIEDTHLLQKTKTNNVDAESRASPSLVKRKQSTILADDTHPLQSSSSHVPVESKEKRHRSLLDCLDQNYFSESPNKIKRETIRSTIGTTPSTNSASDENSAAQNAECCIDIDGVTTTDSTEANNNDIQKLHIDEETNEKIQNQTVKLETLHVVSDASDTPSNADSSSPDIIPGTPPSSVPYDGKAKFQRTLMDFFRTK